MKTVLYIDDVMIGEVVELEVDGENIPTDRKKIIRAKKNTPLLIFYKQTPGGHTLSRTGNKVEVKFEDVQTAE